MKENGILVSLSHLSYHLKKKDTSCLPSKPCPWDSGSGRSQGQAHSFSFSPLPVQGHSSPQHIPHTHTLHMSFRRFKECRTGQAESPVWKVHEASFPHWAEARPWALSAAEPRTGPSCLRPAFHPGQMSPRNITGQKTKPEVALTAPPFLGHI